MDIQHKKILITAALPYANGPIHFGHLAGAYLPADCYARFERRLGHNVCFICGSDEYGVAITLSSELQGRSPKQHVDIFHAINKRLFEQMEVSFDHYSRTTSELHTKISQQFFLDLHKKGLITPMESEQLFCEADGKFYADRYVVGTCPKCGFGAARGDECTRCGASYEAIDLLNPATKQGLKALCRKKTVHWYLRLDLLKTRLLEWIESKHSWKPSVLHFIKGYIADLKPRAITRDMTWGVPVPIPEAAGKVLYVWFDAPIGYISATQEWASQKGGDPDAWKDFWLDPETSLVQFIGKDNIPFHAVTFPAMIMGQDAPYKLVDELPANEFYMLEGRQFSKSDGWYVDLAQFLESFDAELLRYCIAANAPETQDSDFSWKDFQLRVNSDLVGKLGNFVHRTLVFAKNNCQGMVPALGQLSDADKNFLSLIHEKMDLLKESFQSFRLRRATQLIMEIAQAGNVYFDLKKPWSKAVSSEDERGTAINLCLECVRLLALAISPILPRAAASIDRLLSFDGGSMTWDAVLASRLQPGTILGADPKPLFQKIEDSVIEVEQAKLSEKSTLRSDACEPPKTEGAAISTAGNLISFDEFQKTELEVVEIVAAEAVPKSKKLLRLEVLSRSGKRQIISGIAQYYSPQDLVGKKVVACTNLQPAKLMGLESCGMILAASGPSGGLEVIEARSSSVGDVVK